MEEQLKVLVIESDPWFRQHILDLCHKLGYGTSSVQNVGGAKAFIEDINNYSHIICSVRMEEGENGIAFTKHVLKTYDTDHRPPICLTDEFEAHVIDKRDYNLSNEMPPSFDNVYFIPKRKLSLDAIANFLHKKE